MRRRALVLIMLAVSILSLSGCRHKNKEVTQESTVQQSTESAEPLDIKIGNTTLETTSVQLSESESVQVIVLETDAAGNKSGVTTDNRTYSQMEHTDLTSKAKLTEQQSNALDAIGSGYSHGEFSIRDVEANISSNTFDSLTDADKKELIDYIKENYEIVVEETSAISEEEGTPIELPTASDDEENPESTGFYIANTEVEGSALEGAEWIDTKKQAGDMDSSAAAEWK